MYSAKVIGYHYTPRLLDILIGRSNAVPYVGMYYIALQCATFHGCHYLVIDPWIYEILQQMFRRGGGLSVWCVFMW